MTCKCGSHRIMNFNGKCADLSSTSIDHLNFETDGYVPSYGLGGGDYVRIDVCLDCGQIQDWTPITDEDIKTSEEYIMKFGESEEEEVNEDVEPVITLTKVTTAGVQISEANTEYVRIRHLIINSFGLNYRNSEEACEILIGELVNDNPDATKDAIRQLLKEFNNVS